MEENDDTETPITREQFHARLIAEARKFSRLPNSARGDSKPFYLWWQEFEDDVFAPEGP